MTHRRAYGPAHARCAIPPGPIAHARCSVPVWLASGPAIAPPPPTPQPHAAAAHPLGVRARPRISVTRLDVPPRCRAQAAQRDQPRVDVPARRAASGRRAAKLHEPGTLEPLHEVRALDPITQSVASWPVLFQARRPQPSSGLTIGRGGSLSTRFPVFLCTSRVLHASYARRMTCIA